MAERPKLLIEQWLPLDVLGAEQTREKSMGKNTFPGTVRLHVWWARRPLLISRAAILASVLPAWDASWPTVLKERFPTEQSYRKWFVKLCGVFGDSVAGRAALVQAKADGIAIPNPYGYARAFTVNPSEDNLDVLGDLLEHTWGRRRLAMLDPFAGGGSIPFEAMRYGFETHVKELNPVACVILKATLEYPFRFGPSLKKDIQKYGRALCDRVRDTLRPFFSDVRQEADTVGVAYLWARTVKCPYTGKPIPLSPNWWLAKGRKAPVAVRPIFDLSLEEARFEILTGKSLDGFNPDEGTVSRGKGVSPWAQNQPVDGDYIKAEAQAGRMGHQLYCVAIKKNRGFEFRSPTDTDLEAVERAEEELARKLPEWDAKGWVPDEPIPEGNKTSEPRRYGMRTWRDVFSPRQLLSLSTFVEAYYELKPEIESELPVDRAKAVLTYLALALDKAADRNSLMARWIPQRLAFANTFASHDFGFKWSFGEFDGARNLFPWSVDQVVDAYEGITALACPEGTMFEGAARTVPVSVTKASATDLAMLPDQSVDLVLTDPPYYDNVMYAELADFFYVWMKRTVGDLYPEFFDDFLTNKDDEAVANVARFSSLGRKKKALAQADYERKMAASFREASRVLTDDGVLTVMFTHKKVEAWDTLATSLMDSGFTIYSSWPVHTEFAHSLHQAKKNAAKSTILLTCRKREASAEPVWWDDLKGEVRRTARRTAEELEALGISGVDLYIATFGPTLAILSEHWPVLTSEVDEKTGEPRPLRPDVALDLAREEVIRLRKQGLLLGREIEFDPYTDWYLMAWDAFRAEQFPADEARKLALALGLDLEREVISERRLVAKKGSDVVILAPGRRRGTRRVNPDADQFDSWIDAAHTAMLLYSEDGANAARAFLDRMGFLNDSSFKAVLQALIYAIPRTRQKDQFVRPEAATLEKLRLSFFDDLEVPEDGTPEPAIVQEEAFQEYGAQ